jgi:hypothetical protein
VHSPTQQKRAIVKEASEESARRIMNELAAAGRRGTPGRPNPF